MHTTYSHKRKRRIPQSRRYAFSPPPIWIRNYILFYRPAEIVARMAGMKLIQQNVYRYICVYHFSTFMASKTKLKHCAVLSICQSFLVSSFGCICVCCMLLDDAHIKALQLRLSIYWLAIKVGRCQQKTTATQSTRLLLSRKNHLKCFFIQFEYNVNELSPPTLTNKINKLNEILWSVEILFLSLIHQTFRCREWC